MIDSVQHHWTTTSTTVRVTPRRDNYHGHQFSFRVAVRVSTLRRFIIVPVRIELSACVVSFKNDTTEKNTRYVTLRSVLADPLESKREKVTSIIKRFPLRKFILVGDSGEKDPEVYAKVERAYHNQVIAIYYLLSCTLHSILFFLLFFYIMLKTTIESLGLSGCSYEGKINEEWCKIPRLTVSCESKCNCCLPCE